VKDAFKVSGQSHLVKAQSQTTESVVSARGKHRGIGIALAVIVQHSASTLHEEESGTEGG